MSREYAEKKIKEALKRCNGNATKARQMVIAMTREDHTLLQALTSAHLTGIVAYNIERILSGRSDKSDTAQAKAAEKAANQPGEENFGKELLKAVAGNSGATFGLEGYSRPSKRVTKVSKGHIDAINALTRGRKSTD